MKEILINHPLVFIPLLHGILLITVGYLFKAFPPKKINHVYGYRTSASRNSQRAWDHAQLFSAKSLIRWGTILSLSSVMGYIVPFSFRLELALAILWGLIASLMPIYLTERSLGEFKDV